jgi:hypothetical protein
MTPIWSKPIPPTVVGITLVVGSKLVDTTDVVLGMTLVGGGATLVEAGRTVVVGLTLDVGAGMVVAGTVDGALTVDGIVVGETSAGGGAEGNEPRAAWDSPPWDSDPRFK